MGPAPCPNREASASAQAGQPDTNIDRELAKKLKRDRSRVTRDVQVLERFGVIQVTEKPLSGHGRQKWITPLADEIQLTDFQGKPPRTDRGGRKLRVICQKPPETGGTLRPTTAPNT